MQADIVAGADIGAEQWCWVLQLRSCIQHVLVCSACCALNSIELNSIELGTLQLHEEHLRAFSARSIAGCRLCTSTLV
jgi:hypothetical protein